MVFEFRKTMTSRYSSRLDITTDHPAILLPVLTFFKSRRSAFILLNPQLFTNEYLVYNL